MSEFLVALGESRFHLELSEDCAALLPAFYPAAQATGALEAPLAEHAMAIETLDASLVGTWTEASSGRAVEKRFSGPEAAMFALEEAIELLVIADATNNLALHGGAVRTGPSACLILGDSNSGKSSTIFQLVELGAGFLCEEIALCDTRTWTAVPYPQSLALTEALLEEFASSFGITGRRHPLVPPIVRYVPHQLPGQGDETSPVNRILLPRFRQGAPTSVSDLAPDQALTEVLGYSFQPNADAETHFDRMIALVERVQTFRLVYSSAAAARAALTELFEL